MVLGPPVQPERRGGSGLDAGALRQYIARSLEEGGPTTEGQGQAEQTRVPTQVGSLPGEAAQGSTAALSQGTGMGCDAAPPCGPYPLHVPRSRSGRAVHAPS